jgi:hypothetical protein
VSVVAELGLKPITVYEKGKKLSAWEIYDRSGPGVVSFARWIKAIDGHKFSAREPDSVDAFGFTTKGKVIEIKGKGAMTRAMRNPAVAKVVRESNAMVVPFKRMFNEVLNARRLVNTRMEEFMARLGFAGERIYVSGPLAFRIAKVRVGLMTLREYRHRSPVEKDTLWEFENVVIPKLATGKELSKSQKMVLWLEDDIPMKELMRLTENFGERMSLRRKSRKEVLETLFPNKSISAALTEFHEEFMGADLSSFGNAQNVPEGFKDRLPGENPEDDEANLDWGLFYDRMEEFTEEEEEIED